MRPLRYLKFYVFVGLLYAALVAWLSLTPHPPQLGHVRFLDKWEHFLAYGLFMAWFGQLIEPGRAKLWLALGLVAFGGVMELLQGYGAVRQMELADAVANAAGVALGFWLTQGWGGRFLTNFENG